MKNLLAFVLILVLFSCTQNSPSSQSSETTAPAIAESASQNFDWILGAWLRTNDDEGEQTYENWKKVSQRWMARVSFAKIKRTSFQK